MGALIAWIIRGASYAGPAAIGYFFNDLASTVAGWFGPKVNVTDKSGGYAWWFVAGLFIVAGAIVLFILKMFGGKKFKL